MGMERVQALIVSLLPSPDESKKPLAVLQQFNAHSQDKLLTFAGTGATTLFTNCKKFCQAICEGASPSFQGATETTVFKGIKDQLLLFAELEVAGSSASARVIRGLEAFKYQYNKVVAMEQPPTHPYLTMLHVFCWCLSKSEVDKVKEWRAKASPTGLGSASPAGPAADSTHAASVPTKAGTSKARQSKAKHLDDMTKALFKR